jgi:hypothetical protein
VGAGTDASEDGRNKSGGERAILFVAAGSQDFV